MPAIKLHLDDAEYNAVARYAATLETCPEAVAYAALNRLMLCARQPEIRADIVDTWATHRQNLPLWSDSGGSVHAYEGKGDDDPAPSRYL